VQGRVSESCVVGISSRRRPVVHSVSGDGNWRAKGAQAVQRDFRVLSPLFPLVPLDIENHVVLWKSSPAPTRAGAKQECPCWHGTAVPHFSSTDCSPRDHPVPPVPRGVRFSTSTHYFSTTGTFPVALKWPPFPAADGVHSALNAAFSPVLRSSNGHVQPYLGRSS
jgi:hypothetical protein